MVEDWRCIIIATILSLAGRSMQCPLDCRCLRPGYIDCSNSSLTSIRLNNSLGEIHFFNISSNKLLVLREYAFLKENVNFTGGIDLSFNLISDIHVRAFTGLQSLEELYLQGNYLDRIDPETFLPLNYLKILDLSNNSIKRIKGGTFANLQSLESLNLRGNLMREFHQEVYDPLRNLQQLQLQFRRKEKSFDIFGSEEEDDTILICLCERTKAMLWSDDHQIPSIVTCDSRLEITHHNDPIKDCRSTFRLRNDFSPRPISEGDLIIAVIITVGVLLLLIVSLAILAIVVRQAGNKHDGDSSEMDDFEPYRGQFSPFKDDEFIWPTLTSSVFNKNHKRGISNTTTIELSCNDVVEKAKPSEEKYVHCEPYVEEINTAPNDTVQQVNTSSGEDASNEKHVEENDNASTPDVCSIDVVQQMNTSTNKESSE